MRSLPLFLPFLSNAIAFAPTQLPATHQRGVGSACIRTPSPPRGSAKNLDPFHHYDVTPSWQPFNSCSNIRKSVALHATAASVTERQFRYKKRIATFMAFMTGWADYVLITKYKFFGTMMTGNSMWLAAALVESRFRDAMFYITVILAYCVGVGAFRRAELSLKDKALNGLFAPIVAGFLIWSDFLTWRDPTSRWVPALLLSFAWAIINSVGSEVTGNLIFVVTGAMTRCSNAIVDRISRTAGRQKIQRDSFLMCISVILGFFFGAFWAVFLSHTAPQLKSGGAFSIMGALYGALFLWIDRDELGAWWHHRDGELCEIDEYDGTCNPP